MECNDILVFICCCHLFVYIDTVCRTLQNDDHGRYREEALYIGRFDA